MRRPIPERMHCRLQTEGPTGAQMKVYRYVLLIAVCAVLALACGYRARCSQVAMSECYVSDCENSHPPHTKYLHPVLDQLSLASA